MDSTMNKSISSNVHFLCYSRLLNIKLSIVSVQKSFIKNLNSKQPVVHYFKAPYLVIYSPITAQKCIITFAGKINGQAETIAYGRTIFLMGGDLTSDVYQVDLLNKELIAKKPMYVRKCHHSLCSNYGYIYSIGGEDSTHCISDCEKYNTFTNDWSRAPDLITPRRSAGTFIFNNTYIYCFCGFNTDCIRSMERLSIMNMKSWESLAIAAATYNSERWGMHGIQINDTQAIVFGGCADDDWFNDCYMMNMTDSKLECAQVADLSCGSPFCYTTPVLVSGAVYGVDYLKRIHKYDNGQWELIK
jgi:hypothetical protein